ncbi:hypothetical protein [Martelella alba]|uniref:Uncharacterized protein n=1 Tax=Martelella alba TaxID=2590451 RepID=A0ABY2SKM2_9HYPH|nr:hypothetical protein [Martelella alba]TKI06126.1 hypothetical protein FCN80_11450 [Martelella alba]
MALCPLSGHGAGRPPLRPVRTAASHPSAGKSGLSAAAAKRARRHEPALAAAERDTTDAFAGVNGKVARFFFNRTGDDRYRIDPSPSLLVKSTLRLLREENADIDSLAETLTSPETRQPGVAMPYSRPAGKVAVYRWLNVNIFGESLSDFIIMTIARHQYQNPDVLAFLAGRVQIALLQFFGEDTPQDGQDDIRFVKEHVVTMEYPLLAATAHWPVDTHDLEWMDVHAGLAFANVLGGLQPPPTDQEAAALGRMIFLQWKEQAVPVHWISFFYLPAMIRHAMQNPHALLEWRVTRNATLEVKAMRELQAIKDRYEEERDPLMIFNRSLQYYRTRTEFCKTLAVCPSAYLDKLFFEQNRKIAAQFFTVDHMLLTLLAEALPTMEQDFIRHASLELLSFIFQKGGARPYLPAILPAVDTHDHLDIIAPSPQTNVFKASQGNQVRIYAISVQENQYRLQRIDENADYYRTLVGEADKARLDETYALKLLPHDDTLPPAQTDRLADLITFLATRNRDRLLHQLNEYGYQRTSAEKIEDFFLSVIPFYSCVTASRQGRKAEAALTCTADALAFVPLLGHSFRLSLQMSRALATGGKVALAGMRGAMLAELPLRKAIADAGRQFIRYGIARAADEMSLREWLRFGLGLRQALDPGIESMYTLGRSSATQALALGQALFHRLPALKTALPKLSKPELFARLPAERQGDIIIAATGKRRLLAIKLDGDRWREQNVYMALTPEHTGVYGPKYILEENRLVRVPTDIAAGLRLSWPPHRHDPSDIRRMYAVYPRSDSRSAAPPVPMAVGLASDWQPFTDFMPIYLKLYQPHRKIAIMVEYELFEAFYGKPYIKVRGLNKNRAIVSYPYLADAQVKVTQAFTAGLAIMETALDYLRGAAQQAGRKFWLDAYFAEALGISNLEIIDKATTRLAHVLERAIALQEHLHRNTVIVSSLRTADSAGNYPSTLNGHELCYGDLGFVIPGDPQQRIFIIADRVERGYTLHQDELVHTVLHEISHLAAGTDDTMLIDTITLSHGSPQTPLMQFENAMANRILDLAHVKKNLNTLLLRPAGNIIDDETIYRALANDDMFKANVMMMNADNVVKYILDIAAERRGRLKRATTAGPKDALLIQLLLTLIFDQKS